MKVFFFNKRSMAWIILLAVVIVIAIIFLTRNSSRPTGIVLERLIELF